ncbi:DNA-directed RNA polymerase, mitochondrial [Lepeophtheirus salmonis]|uniref:DNA-directed RNA polymerase, mitochondrial n=1 Tax=Lepeophtheirus salmonis TaxID=72036 RepID=UPI001AE98A07|nr:DNA-directed RNA polymerase, mitochondrial-like [Lepeophtheirus salmonis]
MRMFRLIGTSRKLASIRALGSRPQSQRVYKVNKAKKLDLNEIRSNQSRILSYHQKGNLAEAGVLLSPLSKDSSTSESNSKRKCLKDSPSLTSTLCAYVDCMLQVGELYLVSKAIQLASFSLSFIPLPVLLNFLRALATQGQHPNEFIKIWNKYETQEKLCRPNNWYEPRAFMSFAICVGKFENFPYKHVEKPPHPQFMNYVINESLYLNSENRAHFLKGIQQLEWLPSSSSSNLEQPRYQVKILSDLMFTRVKDSQITSQLSGYIKSDLMNSYKIQLETEKKGFTIIDSILHATEEVDTLKAVELVREELCNEWKTKIKASLKTRLSRLKSTELGAKKLNSMSGYPFLSVLPLDTLADVAVEEATRLLTQSETYCPSVYFIQTDLGKKVFRRLEVASNLDPDFIKSFESTYSSYCDWYLNPEASEWWCHREALLGISKTETYRHPERPVQGWTHAIHIFVGKELLKAIMDNVLVRLDHGFYIHFGSKGQKIKFTAKNYPIFKNSLEKEEHPIPPLCPGLYKIYRQRKFSQVEEIKPHPILAKLFNYAKLSSLKFNTNELPMIAPPLPWISSSRGGYLLTNSEFIRTGEMADDSKNKEISIYDISEESQQNVKPVMDSINILGSTPWKVNTKLLDLAIELFNSKKEEHILLIRKLDIPRHPDNLCAPELDPHVLQKVQANTSLSVKELELYKSFSINKQVFLRIKNENYSLWCDCLYRLSLANHFRNNILYFPHNLDFRGRVYPIPPHFNHMGGDLPRSLLVFAKGRPLGHDGLKWLKLQAVNMTGLKKRCSVHERLQYADEILPDILDSAVNPLTGKKWWIESEDPWQTLSVCNEIKAALDSGDPKNYTTHIPIHQDGSCNGLQHYAAIGRDVLGAGSVNLIPNELPQDVYSEIATLVEKKRASDSNSRDIARILEGYVKRKVIKQTVMTTVYGVTAYGARLQIARQLKDIEDFPSEYVEEASKYLAVKTFDSLNELFTASQEIQLWLTESATVISKIFGANVEWETPLGLKVIQPYRKALKGGNKSNNLWGSSTAKRDTVNSAKQRNGFPPNYIHSLDSSHMMLTSLHLWNSGVTFASVHDCYWTHPITVYKMNESCREQFINLHSQPLLENLSDSFKNRYMNSSTNKVDTAKAVLLFKNIPSKGSLDLNVVRNSVFFFS